MALEPYQKAKLALWLCAARHFDPECHVPDDPKGLSFVKAARGALSQAAECAALSIDAGEKISPYLLEQVSALDRLLGDHGDGAGDVARTRLRAAQELLRAMALRVRIEGTGDGSSRGDEGGPPCSCGVLELAAQIEARACDALETAWAAASVAARERQLMIAFSITYTTSLTDDDRRFRPFQVGGRTSIIPWQKQVLRRVGLALKNEPLTSRSLWHVAYTLHHELVCHALQGAFARGPVPDAPPKCHWSEGWMDTLAFDLVRQWDAAPLSWLPLRGDTALDALHNFHHNRYGPVLDGLSDDDLRKRQRARDAYRSLARTLQRYELVNSIDEADDKVRCFHF